MDLVSIARVVNPLLQTVFIVVIGLGYFYTIKATQTMIEEMRDAAGDSREFYTPRSVVHFMVEVVDPRLGETVFG